MQEILIETIVKWFTTLDFQLSRKGENYIFICEKLGIHINTISQDEFFTALTTQLLLKIEDIFNLKSWNSNIDLCSLFGIKKLEEVRKPETEKKPENKKPEKKPEPSAKSEKEPENIEDWIQKELKKAFERGDLSKIKEPDLEPFVNPYIKKEFPRFPRWNEVICFVESL